MGQNKSRPKEPTTQKALPAQKTEEVEEVYLGAGIWGKVYRKGDRVVKRAKFDPVDDDFHRELRFFSWIAGLDKDEQVHFARLHTHRIRVDATFVHVPEKAHYLGADILQRLERRNKSQFTFEIESEYKGQELVFSGDVPMHRRYGLLVKVLTIIKIMKKHHVYHEDIHGRNLVGMEVGGELQIALIDYGVTFFKGEREPAVENTNEMLMQVVNSMVNFGAVWDAAEDQLPASHAFPEPDMVVDFVAKEAPDIHAYAVEFGARHSYALHPTLHAAMANLLRVKYPQKIVQLYGVRDLQEPWFSYEDVRYVFEHWADEQLEEMIAHFSALAAERK